MTKYADTDDLKRIMSDLIEYLYVLQTIRKGDSIVVDLLGSGRKVKLKVLSVAESNKSIQPKGTKNV